MVDDVASLTLEPQRRIGRRAFAWISLGAFLLWFQSLVFADANIALIVVASTLITLGVAYAAQFRLVDMGYSRRWAWLMFVPGVNVWLALRCVMYPPGHRETRRLDRTAWIVLAMFVLGVVILNAAGIFVASFVVTPESP